MTTATKDSLSRAIEYPDSDGKPMADNTLQFKWIVVIKEGVDALFRHEDVVFVAGDLLWYPVEGKNRLRMAPDTLVAFGRPRGYRGSYKQWVEGGIAPQVVFEVLSPGNRPGQMKRKFQFYEKYGVEEYYIYDPDNGDLEGWLRSGKKLRRVERMDGFVSPRLGIRFEPGEGPDNLRIIRPDGKRFLTYQEILEERNAAEERAQTAEQRVQTAEQRVQTAEQRAQTAERQRADESQRADAERVRAERLAAKLSEMGIDAD
jgi:Uma2 family endonuclease